MWQRVRELQAALRPLFSFLDSVRQHMASPSKISKSANLKIICMTNVTQTSVCSWVVCPGMNSRSDRSSSLKRAPPTTRFSAVGSCQAGDGIPSQTGEPSLPSIATHCPQLTFLSAYVPTSTPSHGGTFPRAKPPDTSRSCRCCPKPSSPSPRASG